jgi:3-hydroxyisobutyrate dehydrogenase-like beta-hydroxyacid dehydrogenase
MTGHGENKRVSVIGIGNMGAALAEALLGAGHEVTLWNRTAEKCRGLIEKGAGAAGSAPEAAAAAEVTILCVTDHAASQALLHDDEVARALSDKLLVQLSTMTAEQSREIGLWAEAQGAAYLEGTILGLPQDVTGGSATVVFAGPRDAFEANRDLFLALGGNPQHVSEEIGTAVTFDKVIYAFVYGLTHAFIQGAALAHANGLSIEAYTGTAVGRMQSFVWKLEHFGGLIAQRNHDDVQCRLDIHAAAFADTLTMCRELGVDDALPAAVMQNFERAIAAGHGDREITAVFEALAGDKGRAPQVNTKRE